MTTQLFSKCSGISQRLQTGLHTGSFPIAGDLVSDFYLNNAINMQCFADKVTSKKELQPHVRSSSCPQGMITRYIGHLVHSVDHFRLPMISLRDLVRWRLSRGKVHIQMR